MGRKIFRARRVKRPIPSPAYAGDPEAYMAALKVHEKQPDVQEESKRFHAWDLAHRVHGHQAARHGRRGYIQGEVSREIEAETGVPPQIADMIANYAYPTVMHGPHRVHEVEEKQIPGRRHLASYYGDADEYPVVYARPPPPMIFGVEPLRGDPDRPLLPADRHQREVHDYFESRKRKHEDKQLEGEGRRRRRKQKGGGRKKKILMAV